MAIAAFDAWVKDTFGIDPATYPPSDGRSGGAPERPDPWATAPRPAPSTALPSPMQADCTPVHGKVRGPKNHVLCSKHGHVLDTDTHMVIAHDIRDYEARQLAGKVAAAAAPIVQGMAKMAETLPFMGHASKGPATSSPAAPVGGQSDAEKFQDTVAMRTVAHEVVEYLILQYMDLSDGIQETVDHWTGTIEKLKEAAPKEPGGLLSQLGSALLTATSIVFPELAVVKVALTVKDMSEKVDKAQEADKDRAEAAKAKALFSSKMQAIEALHAFGTEVRKEARNTRGALMKRVNTALANYTPTPEIRKRLADDFEGFAGEFAKDHLGIKIGKDQDAGAVQKVQAQLSGQIGAWLKQQYVQEHEAAELMKGSEGMFVAYGAFTAEQVAERVQQYLKDHPDRKAEIDAELRGDYTKEFKKKVLGIDD